MITIVQLQLQLLKNAVMITANYNYPLPITHYPQFTHFYLSLRVAQRWLRMFPFRRICSELALEPTECL